MGTNYYAHWRPPGSENVTVRLHICKSLRMFNGLVFPSWQAWKAFLRYNDDSDTSKWFPGQGALYIESEYSERIPVEKFIEDVEATDPEERQRQYRWCVDNDGKNHYHFDPEKDWLDDDGFSFYRGEFF